jgi:hypothetical protein
MVLCPRSALPIRAAFYLPSKFYRQKANIEVKEGGECDQALRSS